MRARRQNPLLPRFGVHSCILAVALALAPASAHAQPDTSEQRAGAFSAQARDAYVKGNFREAVDLYKKARELKPDPTLLFNLARCYEALGSTNDLRDSVASYQAYLQERGDASDRAAVERRMTVLERQVVILEEHAKAEQLRLEEQSKPKVLVPVPPPLPVARTSVAPWIVAGAGIGVGVAGAILGLVATGTRSDAVAEPSGAAAADLESRARSFATAANVAFIVGAALTVAGTAWGVVNLTTSPRPVVVRAGAGTLLVSGTF